ncbi:MAG: hypothetical protein J6C29_04150 [Clostridia bacterium]|nr:hypothetical protein [Clostridia bacterium]
MNKKQLSLQNSSLFAELERKTKEINILGIRLEEAEKKANALSDENEALKQSLEKADSENKNLFEKNKELETALAEAKAKAATTFTVIDTFEPEPEIEALPTNNMEQATKATEPVTETENENPVEKEEEKAKQTLFSTDQPITNQDEETVTEVLTPPATEYEENLENSLTSTDLLRDYGAKTIGKVTRVTAEVLSKVSAVNDEVSESLKTLALGKNESFKFQIMKLAKKNGDQEKIMAEMDLLADEAIIYLRSI